MSGNRKRSYESNRGTGIARKQPANSYSPIRNSLAIWRGSITATREQFRLNLVVGGELAVGVSI